jgi:hypothetical protein
VYDVDNLSIEDLRWKLKSPIAGGCPGDKPDLPISCAASSAE